jgi:hypothetical protein
MGPFMHQDGCIVADSVLVAIQHQAITTMYKEGGYSEQADRSIRRKRKLGLTGWQTASPLDSTIPSSAGSSNDWALGLSKKLGIENRYCYTSLMWYY